MLADIINASKLPVAQKEALVGRLVEMLCSHQLAQKAHNILEKLEAIEINNKRK